MLNESGLSGGMNPALQKLVQQKMVSEMFGINQVQEPVLMEASVTGTDAGGSFGVMGVRLMPPTTTQPFPRLLLETNGQLTIKPHHLKQLVGFFQRIEPEVERVFAEQQKAATKLEGYELFGAMLGV